MADQATYIAIKPRTLKVGAVAIARGTRVNRAADGTCAVADATTRGQFIALTDGQVNYHFQGVSVQNGEKVPVVASVAATPGAPAYAAAGGLVAITGSVLLGAWTTTTDPNTLGEIELFNPA